MTEKSRGQGHAYPSRFADKFVVRLADGVRERILAMSKEKHMSMNSLMHGWVMEGLLRDEGGAARWVPRKGMVIYDTLQSKVGEIVGFTLRQGELYINYEDIEDPMRDRILTQHAADCQPFTVF
jgi:hypothetical protein